jgi:hypothetical protein
MADTVCFPLQLLVESRAGLSADVADAALPRKIKEEKDGRVTRDDF